MGMLWNGFRKNIQIMDQYKAFERRKTSLDSNVDDEIRFALNEMRLLAARSEIFYKVSNIISSSLE